MSENHPISKIALIGLGGVSNAHLVAYQQIPSIKVVAGADISEKQALNMAKKYNFTPYTDIHQMMNKEVIDFVVVCVPCRFHAEVVREIAPKGIPILVEKPLANSVEEAQSMVNICEKYGTPLAYGASYRWLPACIKAKELIQNNQLGNISLLTENSIGGRGKENFKDLGPNHYRPKGLGGGGMGLVDHGIHLIDLFRWMMNTEVISVFGQGNYSGQSPSMEYAILNFANGAVGHLIYNEITFSSSIESEGIYSWGGSWSADGSMNLKGGWESDPGNIRIHGETGSLRIYHYANKLFLSNAEGQQPISVLGNPMPGNFGMQLESFITSINEKKTLEVPASEGIKALEILEAIYRSHKLQKVVHL